MKISKNQVNGAILRVHLKNVELTQYVRLRFILEKGISK